MKTVLKQKNLKLKKAFLVIITIPFMTIPAHASDILKSVKSGLNILRDGIRTTQEMLYTVQKAQETGEDLKRLTEKNNNIISLQITDLQRNNQKLCKVEIKASTLNEFEKALTKFVKDLEKEGYTAKINSKKFYSYGTYGKGTAEILLTQNERKQELQQTQNLQNKNKVIENKQTIEETNLNAPIL